jgi:ABC-2 type transport system permease protein
VLGTLFKHELRQLAADRSLYALAFLLVAVLGLGLAMGLRSVADQEQAIATAKREEAAALARAKDQARRVGAGQERVSWWESAADTRGFVWAHLLSYAVKPPAPLAPLAVGQSDLYPYLLKVTTDRESNLTPGTQNINAKKLLLGPFDLGFAITYLLPLFILALCYDLLAGEREAGILGLIASQPVSMTRLVLVKIGFRFVFIVSVLILLAGAALCGTGLPIGAPGVWSRWLAWFGVVVAYGAFWFLLGTSVVSRGWTSATNTLVLAGLWLVLVVLIPAGVGTWVTTAYPPPSRIEYIETLRDTDDAIDRETDRLTERFFTDHPELRSEAGAEEAGWHIGGLERDRRLKAVEGEFTAQLERQQDLAERLKFLSPALLVHSALLDLTGTGLARHRQFLAQVDRYHGALQAYFAAKLIRGDYAFTGFDEYPRFEYREEPEGDLALRLAADLFGLLIPALVMALAGSPGLRRYSVMAGR